jgi:hypothetical protein
VWQAGALPKSTAGERLEKVCSSLLILDPNGHFIISTEEPKFHHVASPITPSLERSVLFHNSTMDGRQQHIFFVVLEDEPGHMVKK